MQSQVFSLNVAAIAMANAIALVMENAQQNEKNAHAIQNASVTQCCALMIAAGAASAAKG